MLLVAALVSLGLVEREKKNLLITEYTYAGMNTTSTKEWKVPVESDKPAGAFGWELKVIKYDDASVTVQFEG